MEDDHS